MSIIEKIIVWFKEFFLSFYKSTKVIDGESDIDETTDVVDSDSNFVIRMRNCIKDYSIINMKIDIDGNETELPESLKYHEEYILESNNKSEQIKFTLYASILCDDYCVIDNLSFTRYISKGDSILNVTDKLFGLIPITFGAAVEDFEPVETKLITL